MSEKELKTSDDLDVELCTVGGVGHDWRPKKYLQFNRPHTSFVCIWCSAVCCGDVGDSDPCIEAYHHRVDHRTAMGITWPIGGNRP